MTARERYLGVMRGEPGVQTLFWEFGYWAAALDRWYHEGLPRSCFSLTPGLPAAMSICGEGLSWPSLETGEVYRDIDVHRYLNLDAGAVRVHVRHRGYPPFREEVLEEDASTVTLINPAGVKVRLSKNTGSVPQFLAWPVMDRNSWEKIKEERFALDMAGRFPDRWTEVAASYRQRDFPLGVLLDGFFAGPRELMGVEHLLLAYYDDPQLIHDINTHLTELYLAILEEIFSCVELDFVYFWEDMSYNAGPLISPALFDEFIVPYYRRLTDFIKNRGVDIIMVDTDGDCEKLIPGFLKGGITGLYPFEVHAGMDIVAVRQQFPELMVMGGLDKLAVARGKEAIDAELQTRLPAMLAQGRYIPCLDHLVPPGISWENFCYYRQRLRDYVCNR